MMDGLRHLQVEEEDHEHWSKAEILRKNKKLIENGGSNGNSVIME